MWSYLWIEGERNLHEFCLKRFKELPRFIETTGRCKEAIIRLIYKLEDGYGGAHEMYFLKMKHDKGVYDGNEIDEIQHWTYEQIKTDRTAILRRRE